MRSRSAVESWSGRENAFETVILLTPTRSATVCSVTRLTGARPFPSAAKRTSGRSPGRAALRRRRDGDGRALEDVRDGQAGTPGPGRTRRRFLDDGGVRTGAVDLEGRGGPGEDECVSD